MSAGSVLFNLASFPAGYCWPGPAQYGQDLIALLTGQVSGGEGIIIQDDIPDAEDRDKLWIRTSSGKPVGLYIYSGGWCWPHACPAGGSERRLYVGTLESLKTYDGGVDEALSATTGPMWAEDTNFQFRIPMGVGTNGTAYNGEAATSITVGETKGAEQVALTTDNLPEHKHASAMVASTVADGQNLDETWENLQGSVAASPTTRRMCDCTAATHGSACHPYTEMAGETAGNIKSASVLNPVIGCYIIKRTTRQYYTVTS